jgi:hypothetical protein
MTEIVDMNTSEGENELETLSSLTLATKRSRLAPMQKYPL